MSSNDEYLDLIGEKTLHVPVSLVRKFRLGRRGGYYASTKIPIKFEIVKFDDHKGIFVGYLAGRNDRNRYRQRRLWMKVSKGSFGCVCVNQIGTVKQEKKIPFRSRKRMRSPLGKSNAQNVSTSPLSTPVLKKRRITNTYGNKTSLEKEDSPPPTSSPPVEKKSIVSIESSPSYMGLPIFSNSTPASPAPPTTPLPDNNEADMLLMSMLQSMRQEEQKVSSSRLEMPVDHSMIEILSTKEHEKIVILKNLASENFTQTGSIPVPDAPEPATLRTRSMESKWTTKHQRVALLRCHCNKQKERHVGYISWIEFEPRDSNTFVPPPVVLQIYVSKSHRGSSAPHGGHFGKRMFEWLARRAQSRCEVLNVCTPNRYSQTMLRDSGWYHLDGCDSSLPNCVSSSGDLYVRFSKKKSDM